MTKMFDLLTFFDCEYKSSTSELATYIYGDGNDVAKNAVRQLVVKLKLKGWIIIESKSHRKDTLHTISESHNELISKAMSNQSVIDQIIKSHHCPNPHKLMILIEGNK